MSYNITALQSTTNPIELISIVNTSVDGLLMMTFIIALFLVQLMTLKRYEFSDAFLVSSFTSFIISLLFAYAGWVTILLPLAFAIFSAGSYMLKVVNG